MYADIEYIAGEPDEMSFRQFLRSLGLETLPERPGGPAGLERQEIEQNRRRMLSCKPITHVACDPRPFPHYSSAVAPLILWDVSLARPGMLIAGRLRHDLHMESEGAEYAQIGRLFSEIRTWMRSHWRPVSAITFVGPHASMLLSDPAYRWSPFDPEKTTVAVVDLGGADQELPYDEWLDPPDDR